MKPRTTGCLILFLFARCAVWAGDNCDVCGEVLPNQFYTVTDRVDHTKKRLCARCVELITVCYLCGVPAFRDFAKLPDGRILCKRDLASAVLDETEARRICDDMMESVSRQFSRFTTFPRTNVTVELMDRVRLQEMFKVAGRDYVCPNIWGCVSRATNGAPRAGYQISLLSGLTRPLLKAACVHEYTHIWIFETVPDARRKQLHHDANEGFCELVAYLAMQAQQETDTMQDIRSNLYTRGQVFRFIEAEERFGFNDVVDWMLGGEDDLLHADDLGRVRRVVARTANPVPAKTRSIVAAPAPRAPETLSVRSIVWNPGRPMASINDHTFEPGEQARVHVGATNVLLRCVAIRPDTVVVQLVDSGEKRELKLTPK